MKESESEVTQSCPTLCDPMDYSLPGSSIHGILQARVLEWVAFSFSRRSSRPRDWSWISHIVGRCFDIWATREAPSKRSHTFRRGHTLFSGGWGGGQVLPLPFQTWEFSRHYTWNAGGSCITYGQSRKQIAAFNWFNLKRIYQDVGYAQKPQEVV